MSSLESEKMRLASTVLGVATHLAIFIRGEWHMQAPFLVKFYLFVWIAIFAIQIYYGSTSREASVSTGSLSLCYALGLFTSISIYRRYFHRLRHFPGPWAAGITKFWHVWKCRNGKNYLVIEQLHKKYGPIIRTGPEELTIIDSSVPTAVDGPKNNCTKAVWYDFLLPEIALNTTRSKNYHDSRRRIWDNGFSTKALAAYEERIVEYATTLTRRIEQLAQNDSPVNVSDWFYWFTFDVMGEFAFARSFEMLENEKWHFAVRLLRRAMTLLGPFSPVPWLAQIAFYIAPWMYIVRDWLSMMEWCKKRMGERIQMKVDRADVSHWLIDASLKKGSLQADREWLNGDAVTIVIAGSDTIAPTLVFAFYELARSSKQQNVLFAELKDVDVFDHTALQRCEHLSALINETLRLHPPVPTGGYRQSPPNGMKINQTYVPGNVTIVVPRYSLARLESAYQCADQFIPERWTTRPHMVKDRRGFAPFSQGRFNCVGKALAMREMRLVIALLVTKFTVEFWDGEDGKRLFADMRDLFTAAPGRLDLRFKIRNF
ncbi:cytochrome P450 [Lentithecium fluviatile CBS 122367]|uniref:Cytochrome P450 n=1 Tax=Lentithecium fluviatile CBS 122367 TaxID=1168545 RepID=A0A6G1IVJ4_9PLEO|nr:cytochrome P450 [Lentithecium fluviatile CBS 122367]